MIEALGIAAALVAGVGWVRVSLLVAALYLPAPTVTAIAFAAWRRRKPDQGAVAFCDGISGELRSGAPLRSAIAATANSLGVPRVAHVAESIEPISLVATTAREAYPLIGEELELTITEVAASGAGGADLFDEIGSLALAQDEVTREVRIASAPARATAGLFLFAPLAFVAFQSHKGYLGELLAYPGRQMVAVAGLALLLVGASVGGLVMWRAR